MWKKIVVTCAVTAAFVGLGTAPAMAGEPPVAEETEQNQQPEPRNSDDQTGLVNLGDIALLNNLNICPDINVLVPIGNILGILGAGDATATTADAPITCTVTSTGRQVGDRPAG